MTKLHGYALVKALVKLKGRIADQETGDLIENAYDEIKALVEQNKELMRGCQAAIAYLADPPSKFQTNRETAREIIVAALRNQNK